MNDKVIYILTVGVAFYAGMKLTQSQVVYKEVVKEVIIKEGPTTSISVLDETLKDCQKQYNELVNSANDQIKNLKADVEVCEERYYTGDLPKEPNLYPEETTEQEPTNEQY